MNVDKMLRDKVKKTDNYLNKQAMFHKFTNDKTDEYARKVFNRKPYSSTGVKKNK